MPRIEINWSRVGWWFFGALAAGMLLLIIHSFIGTFVFSLFIYYSARPFYRRLRTRVPSDTLAASLALLLLASPLVLLMGYATAVGIAELSRLARIMDFGPYEQLIQSYLDSPIVALRDLTGTGTGDAALVSEFITQALRSVGTVLTFLFHLFIMFAVGFYLLRDGEDLWTWARTRLVNNDGPLHTCLLAIDDDFSAIFFGSLLNAAITGLIGLFGYTLLSLVSPPGVRFPFPALLGLLTGVASLVPLLGTKLVYVPATVYLVFEGLDGGLWFAGVFFFISLIAIDTIPDLVLRPYITSRRLHTGLIMFAFILGPIVFGWYGLFLGPIIIVMIAHFANYILPPLIAGDPI